MKYLSFDIESCDGGKNGSLCSFGYCIADENFNIIDSDDIIVNPKKAFNKKLFGTVIKLAYTEDVFRKAPRFPVVYDKIRSLFSDDVTVIGFSVLNDVNYLSDAIHTYRLHHFEYEFYDVQLMYSIHKKESRTYSLAAAAGEFDIEFLEHRSVDDAIATLKVLKGILDAEQLTFEGFVNKYAVMPGRTSRAGTKNSYTDVAYSGIDYNSPKSKKRLLSEFMMTMPSKKLAGLPFSHKVVCFDEELELGDISHTRNLITKLYALGGRYSSGVESSNVFVYENTESARYKYARETSKTGHRLQFMPYSAFIDKLGDIPDNVYDDAAIMCAGNRRRRLCRERAAAKNRAERRSARNSNNNNKIEKTANSSSVEERRREYRGKQQD